LTGSLGLISLVENLGLHSATRPDIAYAVSKLSRFVSNPGSEHWHALERVMCYIVGTMNYGIHYSGDPKVLEGYSDANWISDADELKATCGYVFTLGGALFPGSLASRPF
jgi:hypothetical protein